MEAAFRFRAVPASVSAARDATRNFIESLPISGEDALVVVSELVANAVSHGAEPVALCLAWDGRALQIEVSDGDPRVECVTQAPSRGDDCGRGLILTDRLSASWGAHGGPNGHGKTVWAKIV